MALSSSSPVDELAVRLAAERMLAEQRIGWCSCGDRDGAGRQPVGCGVCDLPADATLHGARRAARRAQRHRLREDVADQR